MCRWHLLSDGSGFVCEGTSWLTNHPDLADALEKWRVSCGVGGVLLESRSRSPSRQRRTLGCGSFLSWTVTTRKHWERNPFVDDDKHKSKANGAVAWGLGARASGNASAFVGFFERNRAWMTSLLFVKIVTLPSCPTHENRKATPAVSHSERKRTVQTTWQHDLEDL